MDDQVEVVDVSDVKIEPEKSSGFILISLRLTTSTWINEKEDILEDE